MPKKGEKHSPEAIEKIKTSRSGQPAWNVGKKWPDIQKGIIYKKMNEESLKAKK